MEVFEYDENVSFEQNFTVWYDMNCRERSAVAAVIRPVLK